MDIVAFDLEIMKPFPDDGDWRAVRPMGITCAAAANHELKTKVWSGGLGPQRYAPAMTPINCRAMVDLLWRWHDRGATIVTFNGLGFDFDILGEECDDKDYRRKVATIALNHVDIAFAMLCEKGFMCSLEGAAMGMGLPGKLEGVDGKLAPTLWTQGRSEQNLVLKYVEQDAVTTMQVYREILKHKKLVWLTKNGSLCGKPWKPTTDFIHDDNLLTVAQCLKLPLPDTSWMTEPWPREKFCGWLQEFTA